MSTWHFGGEPSHMGVENGAPRRTLSEESTSLSHRILGLAGLAILTLGVSYALIVGCDYSAPESLTELAEAKGTNVGAPPKLDSTEARPTAARSDAEKAAILESSIELIKRASLHPGGDNFKYAIQKLNQYFAGTNPHEYDLASESREYLLTQWPPRTVKGLESPDWTLRDTRHVEDCMMYYGIATRVAKTGDNLSQVRRVFEWVVRQVQLVPPGSLGTGRLAQAFARPYDVLMRGMATEADGFWAERTWLFMALCRQLGIDTGLVTYSRSRTLEMRIPRYETNVELEATLFGLRRGPRAPVIWLCAALIDDKAYLFDGRLGMEVPGPDGTGVATLDQALADPAILERMNLPGLAPYGTSRASLLASPTKIGIMLDSSPGYFAPKMKLLQRELAGKDRTILFRDASEQRDHFVRVLGDRVGDVTLWALPMEVDTQLFSNAQFVASIQASLFLFQTQFPLVYARVKHLRGEFEDAIAEYVKLRLKKNAPWVTDKYRTIPKEVQEGMDVYATYYLALAHLERGNLEQAEPMFRKTLEILPEPGPNQPYYNMFRWGANANLGRIHESRNDARRAIAHYVQRDPTSQYVGNQVRARELVWRNPLAPLPDSSTSAPPPRSTPSGKPTAKPAPEHSAGR
jgi:hypothetical protein